MSSNKVNPEDLRPGPIRHARLAPALTLRIEAVRTTLAEVCPISREEWLDGFQRDQHPERAIIWWERVARCYTGFTAKETLSSKEKQAAFKVMFGLFSGLQAKDIVADAAALSESLIDELVAICSQNAQ
jgi:hypothetical protein